MITIKLTSRNIFENLKSLDRNFKNGIRKGLYDLGKVLRDTSRQGIKNPPKSGVYYKYKGRNIRASISGEYPANRSGNLRASVGFDVKGYDRLEFGSRNEIRKSRQNIGLNYGLFLEKGTSKMKARPFLTKSINSNFKKFISIINNSIRREAKIK